MTEESPTILRLRQLPQFQELVKDTLRIQQEAMAAVRHPPEKKPKPKPKRPKARRMPRMPDDEAIKWTSDNINVTHGVVNGALIHKVGDHWVDEQGNIVELIYHGER